MLLEQSNKDDKSSDFNQNFPQIRKLLRCYGNAQSLANKMFSAPCYIARAFQFFLLSRSWQCCTAAITTWISHVADVDVTGKPQEALPFCFRFIRKQVGDLNS